MPRVTTAQIMFESATVIAHLIEVLQNRKVVSDVTPEVLFLLLERSCTHTHSIQYMKDVNTELTKESQDAEFTDMSRLQQAQFKLENHERFNDIFPSSPVAHSQQIPMRVCMLHDYLTNFLQTFLADLHHPQESYIRKKSEAGAFVKKYVFSLDHETSHWYEDAEEALDEDVYYSFLFSRLSFP